MPDIYATAKARAIGADSARGGANAVVALAFAWMLAATYHLLWLAVDNTRAQPVLLANAACICLACWALVSGARWSRYSIILVASWALGDLVTAYVLAAAGGPGAMRAALGGEPPLVAILSIHTGSPWFGIAEVGVWCTALALLNVPAVRRYFHQGKRPQLSGGQAAIAALLMGLQVPGMISAGAVSLVRQRLHICRDHRVGATCPYSVACTGKRPHGSAPSALTERAAPLPLRAPERASKRAPVGPAPRLPGADTQQPALQRCDAASERLRLDHAAGKRVTDGRVAPVKAHGMSLQRAAQGIDRGEPGPRAGDVARRSAVALDPDGDPLVEPARRPSLGHNSHAGVRDLMQAGSAQDAAQLR